MAGMKTQVRPNFLMDMPHLFCVLLLLVTGSVCANAQNPSGIAPQRKSDTFASSDSGWKVRVHKGELAKGNFQIAGVDLAREEDVLTQAAHALGKTPTVSSGDASTGDRRACYRSPVPSDRTRLFVGEGEVDFYFILAAGSEGWKPDQPCLKSSKVTRQLATSSGLRLGETRIR